VLYDGFLREAAGVRGFAGTVPSLWRRFADPAAMIERARAEGIELLLNLRLEDPALDGAWFAARPRFEAAGLRCVDLYDQGGLDGARPIARRIERRLCEEGLLRGPLAPAWLAHLRRPALGTLAVFLGASLAIKRWPAARWIELADRLLAEGAPRVQLLAGSGAGELAYADEIHAALHTRWPTRVELVAGLDLASLTALLAGAELLISHDTFALHLAAALGLPAAGLFLSTLAAVWSPAQVVAAQAACVQTCPAMKPNGTCQGYYGEASGCACRDRLGVDDALAALTSLRPATRRCA
jgi:hypothetical protein